MAELDLADTINRLRKDDKNVLHELFELYYQPVCSAIFRYIKDKALVEDMAQNVFIRFWEKRHTIEVNSSFSAYLRRMAINEALAHLRKQKHYEEEFNPNMVTEVDRGVEQQYLHSELQQNVTDAINTLPPKCKIVFQLSRHEGLTYREIAERMEISVKTVENQMGKALRILREELKGYLS
jgi:RNA polymerase sigma-70 factor (ECF subfamily)